MQVLIHTGTADYMEYKPVDGSFVYRCSIPVAGLCNTVVLTARSYPHNRGGATRCQQLASVRPRPYAPARSSAVCSDSRTVGGSGRLARSTVPSTGSLYGARC